MYIWERKAMRKQTTLAVESATIKILITVRAGMCSAVQGKTRSRKLPKP